jgi:hypothetical protein
MRFQHQTRHAALAVRTQGSSTTTEEESKRQQDESVRRQLIKQFHAIIKEQQSQGVGTGAERVVCWRPGDTNNEKNESLPVAAGNAANAAVVATQAAKKVCPKLN